MSEKELLYVEDALTQMLLLHTKCRNHANMMQDRELKAYCKELGPGPRKLICGYLKSCSDGDAYE